mgnify:CR=1 FL=1
MDILFHKKSQKGMIDNIMSFPINLKNNVNTVKHLIAKKYKNCASLLANTCHCIGNTKKIIHWINRSILRNFNLKFPWVYIHCLGNMKISEKHLKVKLLSCHCVSICYVFDVKMHLSTLKKLKTLKLDKDNAITK